MISIRSKILCCSINACNRPAVRLESRRWRSYHLTICEYKCISNIIPSLFLSTSTLCIVVHKIWRFVNCINMDWFTRYSYETVGAIKTYFSTRCIKSNKDSPKVMLVVEQIREIKLSSLLWKRVSPNRVQLGFNKKFKEADQQ